MKQHIINRTAVSVSCDAKLNKTITTDDIFTQVIRDMILDRLDGLIFDMPLDVSAVEVTLSISEVDDVNAPELKQKGTWYKMTQRDMTDIDQIEYAIKRGDLSIFSHHAMRDYLEAIAKSQLSILKELRKDEIR